MKDATYCIFDTETTGFDPIKNDIISIGAILITPENDIISQFLINMQPVEWGNISPQALEVNGFTIEQLKTFMDFKSALGEFDEWLFANGTKTISPIGWNIDYDIRMMLKPMDALKKNFFHYKKIDLLQTARLLKTAGKLDLKKLKLTDVAKYFGINTAEAHNALADCRMCNEIMKEFKRIVK